MYKASFLLSLLMCLASVRPVFSETLVCSGFETYTYEPPLMPQERQVHKTTTGTLTCQSSGGGGVTGGSFGGEHDVKAVCGAPHSRAPINVLLNWNDGTSSKAFLEAKENTEFDPGLFAFSGKVTQGLYLGQQVEFVGTPTPPSAAECAQGVSRQSNAITLIIS